MWTPTALESEVRPIAGEAWRVVEHQYTVSTRKLVDSKEEQLALENILEASKPSIPKAAAKLHYLLATPFRYGAPYPIGSRFRRAGITEGVFYCSEAIRTALAEQCYYRLRFFLDSPDSIMPTCETRLTVFSVIYRSETAIDLSKPKLVKDKKHWLHPSDYSATQNLADKAREAGITVIRYQSVRDTEKGYNIALLSPTTFRSKKPKKEQTWFLYISETECNCERANAHRSDESFIFKQEQFQINGIE